MKTKILALIVTTFMIGLFSSCEGPMGPQGPAGPPGVNDWKYLNFTVKPDQWIRDRELGIFYYEKEDGGINSNFVDEGIVQVAILQGGTYFPLSQTEYFHDGDYLAETIRYSYGVGWIRIILGGSDLFDGAGENYQPQELTFKVTMLW